MAKAVALNTVHICKKPGKPDANGRMSKAIIEMVKPGRIFELDDKEFNELKAGGFVRVATRADSAAADEDGHIPVGAAAPAEVNLKKSKKPE